MDDVTSATQGENAREEMAMTHRRQAQAAAAVGNGEGDDPAPLLYCPITLTLFRESLSSSMVYIRYTKDVFGPHLKGNNSSMINHLTTGPPALRLLRQHYSSITKHTIIIKRIHKINQTYSMHGESLWPNAWGSPLSPSACHDACHVGAIAGL